MGVRTRYKFIGLALEVYLVMMKGKKIFIRSTRIFIIVISFLDTPASINFKFDTASIAANPSCETKIIIVINIYVLLV